LQQPGKILFVARNDRVLLQVAVRARQTVKHSENIILTNIGRYGALPRLVGCLCLAISTTSAANDKGPVDYGRDIRPILASRCFGCHGPRKQDGGLRLDVRRGVLAGGDHGAVIVTGNSQRSALIRRVTSKQPDDRMPAKGKRLTAAEIQLLRLWIDQGATGMPQRVTTSSADGHWSFQPIRRPALPDVTHSDWPHNAVDHFVLSKLEQRNILPAAAASRATLIRRLHLDLTGLPPAWSRVLQFVADPRPDAYERLVDELLASPRYGERWGRHWLDLARYADSTGYESDQPRQVWAYRDWVINALNADMPFDRFVTEQLAGDLLPGATRDQRIATGFHCNAMLDPGVRQESILDQVNTTGAVFLGLTTGCAQCHAHKTDPLTHREFYQLYAFFNEAGISELTIGEVPEAGSAAPQSAKTQMKDSPPPATTLVMKHSPQPTHIFIRGDHTQPGERVLASFPAFLNRSTGRVPDSTAPASQTRPPDATPLTRLDLAAWLLSPDNPLTARVTANRIWQRFFGLGLVETESDFGIQTPEPLHSALLDYLAGELRGNAQSPWQGLKPLHRLIVTSATYRQSSTVRPELADIDPGNRLLARQRRLRLESELIRDISLSSAGLLCHSLGGPSVFPPQADGILTNRATPATWTPSSGQDRFRRGMYTWNWRLTPHPHSPLFDAPDGVTACTRRVRSNVPVQALTLLNDPSFVEAARALAARIVSSSAESDSERIRLLCQTCLSREPSAAEHQLLQSLITHQRQSFTADPQQALLASGNSTRSVDRVSELATWVVASRVVMNLDEFITRE